ncbi:MAG: hypothetical protein KGD65_05845 [Candidatus Lokiarchaeota archaeon]|nr:hypothetical protein [Candidatus Lokiarchaeota archaeon]
MIASFFLKEINNREIKPSDELSWLRIKLNPNRAIILIASALIWVIFFTQLFLIFVFMFGGVFTFARFHDYLFHTILILIIIFCYYPIGKILKNHRFDKTIENINDSREFKTTWFKFRLNKTNSVILLSVSSTLVILYNFQLLLMNMNAQLFYSNLDLLDSYMLLSFPLMIILIILIITINIYTIIKTLPSIRNFKSDNEKGIDNGNRRNE